MIVIVVALFLALCNVAFPCWRLWRTFRQASAFMFFWAPVLFFVSIPVCADTGMTVFGSQMEWFSLLDDYSFEDVRYRNLNIDASLLLGLSLFVFLFNGIVYLGGAAVTALFTRSRVPDTLNPETILPEEKPYLIVSLGFLWLTLGITYASGYRGTIAQVLGEGASLPRSVGILYPLYPVFGGALLLACLRRRWCYVLLLVFPMIVQAALTSQRPFLVPLASGVILAFALTYRRHPFAWKPVFRLLILGAASLLALVLVRHGQDENLGKVARVATFPVYRDSSTNLLYYTFEYCDSGSYETSHKHATWQFLLTGIKSSTFGSKEDPEQIDPCVLLARIRYGWYWLSLHPTVYGWSMFDLGWAGIFLGLYLGCTGQFSFLYSQRNLVLYSMFSSCIATSFLLIARGSLLFAAPRLIYGHIAALFVLGACRMVTSKSQQPR